MQYQPALWPSPQWYLKKFQPDAPVLYFAPDVLQATAKRFLEGFDGFVTYAVKANDDAAVLDNLISAGIQGFDVASPAEILKVRAAKQDAILHYHNPVRSVDEIAMAVGHGISSRSVDCSRELEKLADVPCRDAEFRSGCGCRYPALPMILGRNSARILIRRFCFCVKRVTWGLQRR